MPGAVSPPGHAAARARAQHLAAPTDAGSVQRAEGAGDGDTDGLAANLRVAIAIVERLTGRRVELLDGDDLAGGDDLDGDGSITDGRELFGPRSGDGFTELAAHDADGNAWIDTTDPTFQRLRLATSDGHGDLRLRTLEESGVGAIGVASVASPFLVTDAEQAIAQVRSTGVVLMDDGSAGTVQHVDLLL